MTAVIDTPALATEQTSEPPATAASNSRALIYRVIGGGIGATLLALLAVLSLTGHTTTTTAPAALAAITTGRTLT